MLMQSTDFTRLVPSQGPSLARSFAHSNSTTATQHMPPQPAMETEGQPPFLRGSTQSCLDISVALDKDFELEELKELACEGSTAVKPNSRMGLNDRRKVSRSSFERESGQQAAYRAVHHVKAELESLLHLTQDGLSCTR